MDFFMNSFKHLKDILYITLEDLAPDPLEF
jgi:hypothetical protein